MLENNYIYLIIDEELYWVVAPFNQHNLVCLTGNTVRKRGPNAKAGTGLEPHAHGKGIHFRQALFHSAKKVVCAQW